MDWEIQQKVAKGTFGTVYKVKHKKTNEIAALKLINKKELSEQERRYMKRGFLAASKIDHPNCVKMIELVENGDDFGFVMEFVEGKPISVIKRTNLSQIAQTLIQVCNGLDALHTMNVVHRDLKPENILITTDNIVKITDFDLVKLIEATQFTTSGTFIGTVKYASPEQCNNASQIDPRSDLYSLGIILYELVTGKAPFEGESWGEIASQHMWSALVHPKQIIPDLPSEIDQIIQKLLQKKPEERFSNAQEVAQALSYNIDESQIVEIKATGNYLLPPTFVNRVLAMQKLEQIFIKVRQNKSKTVFIGGESGIGKSKLWDVFTATRLQNVPVFHAQCRPQGASYESLAAIIKQLLEFIDKKPERAKVNFVGYLAWDLALICPQIAQLPFMEQIAKLPSLDSQNSEIRLFEAITNFLRNIAMMPIVLFFDDLHWADEQLCKWVHYASRNLNDSPVLIVSTYRDNEIFDTPLHAILSNLEKYHLLEILRLEQLEMDEVSLMIGSMLGKSEFIETKFAEHILKQTGGNPLFIQETMKHLLETQKLYKKGEKWNIDFQTFSEITLPKTIQKLITARLDKLDMEVRKTLRAAAVIGRTFDFATLLNITEIEENTLIANLQSATTTKLIDDLSDGEHFRFIHEALKETLESELHARIHSNLHRKVGEILEARHGDDESYIDDLALHFYLAQDMNKSLLYCGKAGDLAKDKFANENALMQYKRAIEMAKKNNQRKKEVEFLAKKAKTLERIGKWDDAINDLDRGILTANDSKNRVKVGELKIQLGRIYQKKGDYDSALKILEDSVKICKTSEDKNILGDAFNKIGTTYRDKSDYDKALEFYVKALEIKEEMDDKKGISRCLNDVGNIYYYKGKYDEALKYYHNSLELKGKIEDQLGIAISLSSIAYAFQRKSDYTRASENFQKSFSIYKKIGDKYGTARSLMGLANIYYLKGNYDKSLEYYEKGLSIKEEIGDNSAVASILSNIGVINKILGDYNAALDYYYKSLTMKEKIGDRSGVAGVLNNIGIIYADKAEHEKALEYYEKSLQIQQKIGDKPRIAISKDNIGVVYLNKGDYDTALEYTEKALIIREEVNDKLGISTSLNNLGFIYYHKGEYEKALDNFQKALKIREDIGVYTNQFVSLIAYPILWLY